MTNDPITVSADLIDHVRQANSVFADMEVTGNESGAVIFADTLSVVHEFLYDELAKALVAAGYMVARETGSTALYVMAWNRPAAAEESTP